MPFFQPIRLTSAPLALRASQSSPSSTSARRLHPPSSPLDSLVSPARPPAGNVGIHRIASRQLIPTRPTKHRPTDLRLLTCSKSDKPPGLPACASPHTLFALAGPGQLADRALS